MFARFLLFLFALVCSSTALAADVAPLCAALADPLATTRSCLVAASFPDVNASVCFDSAGKPSQCTARADRIAVAEGQFQYEGQTYGGAPTGVAYVAAARFDLPANATVNARGVRPNGQALAVDTFRAPPAPPAEPPVIFSPTPVAP